jgi:murein DD-endopeptidase MepM/ murein hydrolase activator NlpD
MMIQKADSLEKSLGNYSLYTKNLKKVLSDSVSLDSVQDLFREGFTVKEFDFKPSVEDSILRAEVEAEESISLNSNLKEKKLNSFFIKPVDGFITEGFNKKIGHFGVDVVSKKGAFISSIDDGMVLFSSWTHEFGYVLVIKHQNSFISFYKHNSEVFKSKGDYVKSGETIAIIGNSGKYSTGPHLHFELWKGSSAVNPVNYILF